MIAAFSGSEHGSARRAAAEITIQLAASNSITGVVRDPKERPLAGARVQITMEELPLIYAVIEEGAMKGVMTNADGRFRLPISREIAEYGSAEPTRVQALHPRYAGAIADMKTGREASPVTITLRDGIEVRGKVKDKEGNAIAGASVLLLQDPFGTVALPLDTIISSGSGSALIESDAEGAFTLHLNEAPHDLSVWKEGFVGFRLAGMTPAAGQKPIDVGWNLEPTSADA